MTPTDTIDLAAKIGRCGPPPPPPRDRPGSLSPGSRTRGSDGLTPRQRECLIFFRSFHAGHGMPPTLLEIAGAMGVRSSNQVAEFLGILLARGFLEKFPTPGGTARYIPAREDQRWDDPSWLRHEAAVLRHCAAEMERKAAELEGNAP